MTIFLHMSTYRISRKLILLYLQQIKSFHSCLQIKSTLLLQGAFSFSTGDTLCNRLPYPRAINDICSYLVREWGILSPSRLVFSAVVKFSFGWRLSLQIFAVLKKLFTQRDIYSIMKIIAGTQKYERAEPI